MSFSDEFKMYRIIEEFLRRELGCYQTAQDVPFPDGSGRRIDVVGLVRQDDGGASELIAVEAKRGLSWEDIVAAIGQAENEKQLVHGIYVAFPKNDMEASPEKTTNIKKDCRKKGIGVLAVSEISCEALLLPKKTLPQPDPNKLRKMVSKFKYEVTEFKGLCFKDFCRVNLYYDVPSESHIAEKKLERLVKEVVEWLKTQQLKTTVPGKLGWKQSEWGRYIIGNEESGEIKGIPFIIKMNHQGLALRVEAKRHGYTKTDLDRIIKRLNDDPSLLKENVDKLSRLSDPKNSYALCLVFSDFYGHDFIMNLHLWDPDNPNIFSSFLNVLNLSREKCAGTRFTPYIVIEFRYDVSEVLYKKKDLVEDIAKRVLQLEETTQLFWTLLKYEWE